jgi:hypothetical protein
MTRQERVSRVVAEAPQSCQKALREAFSGSASPRKAIKAMCLACVGFDRVAIKNCTGYSCPLYLYRPFQDAGAA